MSTATSERPVVVTTTAEIATTEDNISWIAGAKDTTVRAAKTGWSWFTRAMNWIADAAVEVYDWFEDKVVRGSKWLWAKTKNGGARSKRWWIASWNWIADGLIAGWSYVSPALYWASTPVRFALGAIFGTAAVATFGPVILGIAAIGYVTYVLVTGRFWFGSKETTVDKMFKGDHLTLSTDQNATLMSYFEELEAKKATAANKSDRNAIAAQQYVVEQRLSGSTKPAGDLYRAYKALVEAGLNAEDQKGISWIKCNTAVRAADSRVRKLLTQASVSVQPEAVLA